jgi:site-specific DNA-cytosine methylase
MGIPVETEFIAEKVKGALKFAMTAFEGSINHAFTDVTDLLAEPLVKCKRHGASCTGVNRSSYQRLDLVTLGPPCQPLSRRRSHSGHTPRTSKTAAQHPDIWLSCDFIISYVEMYRPRGLIIEQVPQFAESAPDVDGGYESWAAKLQEGLSRLGYSSEMFDLSLDTWIDVARDRTVAMYVVTL